MIFKSRFILPSFLLVCLGVFVVFALAMNPPEEVIITLEDVFNTTRSDFYMNAIGSIPSL